MNIDLQSFLTSFFTALAYGLPLILALWHIQTRSNWRLGPWFYVGLFSALAIVAMLGRVSSFLEVMLTESETGWFSKDTKVALYLAGVSALSLVMFGWVLPATTRSLLAIPNAIGNWWLGLAQTPSHDFLSLSHGKAPGVIATASTILMNLGLALLGALATLVYLSWPAILITIDQRHKAEEQIVLRQSEVAAEQARSRVRARALNAGTKLNQALMALQSRLDKCSLEKCRDTNRLRMDQLQTLLKGWGIASTTDNIYPVEAFEKLSASESVTELHARLDNFAEKYHLVLDKLPALAPQAAFDAEVEETRMHKRDDKNLTRMVEELASVAHDPTRLVAMVAKDVDMTLALGLELIAIALTLAAGLSLGHEQ